MIHCTRWDLFMNTSVAIVSKSRVKWESIDEQIIRFKGRSQLKTYMLRYDKFEKRFSYIGCCDNIVVHLFTKGSYFHDILRPILHFFPLIDQLKGMNDFFVGTIMKNRLKRCPLSSNKELKKGETLMKLLIQIPEYLCANGMN